MRAVLEGRDLTRVFGHGLQALTAVDGVCLRLEEGRTLGIVGESGSGKSTLVHMLGGLVAPSSGTVLFDGRDVAALDREGRKAFRRAVQFIFQDPLGSMNPSFTVARVLDDPQRTLAPDRTKQERDARSRELLALVGLDAEVLSRHPRDLSGGQCQRLAIARALSCQPRVVVCDECTSALDVSVQAQILNLLRDVQERTGCAYLFVTHDMGVVSYMADDLLVLEHGRAVEQGLAASVLADPQAGFTNLLIQSAEGGGLEGKTGKEAQT